MITFILGLALGIGICEAITWRLHYSSVMMDAWDWIKRMRRGY